MRRNFLSFAFHFLHFFALNQNAIFLKVELQGAEKLFHYSECSTCLQCQPTDDKLSGSSRAVLLIAIVPLVMIPLIEIAENVENLFTNQIVLLTYNQCQNTYGKPTRTPRISPVVETILLIVITPIELVHNENSSTNQNVLHVHRAVIPVANQLATQELFLLLEASHLL